jgi:UDP-N-acetylmuramoyl-L-alanyl-D-glutamate--2,6-diaminopimelate ligase
MEDYFAAKRRLFGLGADAVAEPAICVVNVDDPYGARLAGELTDAGAASLMTVSVGGDPDTSLRAADVEFDSSGATFKVIAGDREVPGRLPLPGDFNVANALVAAATAAALGVELADAIAALGNAPPVPGRLEPVIAGQRFSVLVDYAHTPDSLRNVLEAARRLTDGRLITVFGCGGDRDRAKRPLMGEIGARLSDLAVVTSDNPRSEEPGAIIAEILAGIDGGAGGIQVQPDRRLAIREALEAAGEGDAVVIAGKGHEQGQEFEDGRKVPFDDREVAREELGRMTAAGDS